MPEPVGRIRKLSSSGEGTVHIIRAPQNVVRGKIPPVMRVVAKQTITYKDFGPGGGLFIGDQVFSGKGTVVEIEFLIGGVVYLASDNSVQIASERHAIPIGETASRQTRQLFKDVAWELAPVLLVGGVAGGAAYAYSGSSFVAGVAVQGTLPLLISRLLFRRKPAEGGGIGPPVGIRG